jgi:FdhD protein
MQPAIHIPVKKVSGNVVIDIQDMVTTEEPLEIRLKYITNKVSTQKSISVTMRTPGNDAELAVGFCTQRVLLLLLQT